MLTDLVGPRKNIKATPWTSRKARKPAEAHTLGGAPQAEAPGLDQARSALHCGVPSALERSQLGREARAFGGPHECGPLHGGMHRPGAQGADPAPQGPHLRCPPLHRVRGGSATPVRGPASMSTRRRGRAGGSGTSRSESGLGMAGRGARLEQAQTVEGLPPETWTASCDGDSLVPSLV